MQWSERNSRRQLDKHLLTGCWCQSKKAESAKMHTHPYTPTHTNSAELLNPPASKPSISAVGHAKRERWCKNALETQM